MYVAGKNVDKIGVVAFQTCATNGIRGHVLLRVVVEDVV
jgi:hypothetical protein